MTDCPNCSSEMWDNRPKKQSGEFKPTSPDFKCKNKECGHVVWPAKGSESSKIEPQATKLPMTKDDSINRQSALKSAANSAARGEPTGAVLMRADEYLRFLHDEEWLTKE